MAGKSFATKLNDAQVMQAGMFNNKEEVTKRGWSVDKTLQELGGTREAGSCRPQRRTGEAQSRTENKNRRTRRQNGSTRRVDERSQKSGQTRIPANTVERIWRHRQTLKSATRK